MRPQLADDAKPPRRMNWLTASMFAKKFRILVRRAIWTGELEKPELKWVYYESGLWKVYLTESGETVTRVVNGQTLGASDEVLVAADVTLSDLQASDWTALSVECETQLGPQVCPCASEDYFRIYRMSSTPGVDATKDKLDFANPNLTKGVECRDDSTDGNGTDGNGTDGNGTDGNGTDGNGTDGNPTTGGPGTSLGGPNGPSGGNNEYSPLSGPGGPNGGGNDPDAPPGGGPIGGGGPTGPPGSNDPPSRPVRPVLGRSLTLGAVQTDLPECLPLPNLGGLPENPHPVTVEGCTITLEDAVTPNQLWFVKAYFRGATVFNSVMKNGDTANVTMGDKATFRMRWGASVEVTANAWASNKPDIVADPSSFTMPEPCDPTPTPTPPVPTPTPTPPPTPTPTPTPTVPTPTPTVPTPTPTVPTPTPTPPPSPTPTSPPTPTPPGFTPTPTPTPPAPTPTPTPTPP